MTLFASYCRPLLVGLLLSLAWTSSARAGVGLSLHRVEPGDVRVDGSLREWRGVSFSRLGRGRDAALRYALGYDDRGIYVAAEVTDDRMVRFDRPSTEQDALVLTVIPPGQGRGRGTKLWLYAGVPRESRASAARSGLRGRRLRPAQGVKVVEGPRRGGAGYVLEAFVSRRTLLGRTPLEGARGAVALVDVDREAHPEVETRLASAEDGQRLPKLVLRGASGDLLRRFLTAKGLAGTDPAYDLRGDVAGDRRPERVVIVDRFIVVLGPGYRDGEAYDFMALPVESAASVRKAVLRDVTGDGQDELLLVLRQQGGGGSRDVWRVVRFEGHQVRPVFGIELRKATDAGSVHARLRLRRQRRGPPIIEVVAGRARGLDGSSFREARARDAEPILVPWGPVRARRYRYGDDGFERIAEVENPDYEPPARKRRERRAEPSEPTRRAASPRSKPDLGALLEQARRRLGARGEPRFVKTANLVGDPARERMALFGTTLVAVGPGFGDGRGFFHYRLPAEDPADVKSIELADLTGDGAQEVMARVRRRIGELDGDVVSRDVLLIHCFHGGGFPRMAAIEVARTVGDRAVRNRVRTARRRGRAIVVVTPGRARGFGPDRWPFAAPDDGEVAPLLLPWRDKRARFGFADGRFGRL